MQLNKLLKKWDLTSLKITAPFLQIQCESRDEDNTAAWKLDVELITRAATQDLDPDESDEAAALKSIHDAVSADPRDDQAQRPPLQQLHPNRRRRAQSDRPPVHRQVASARADGPLDGEARERFRTELRALQTGLRNCTCLLADMADVEDLIDLEAI